MSADVRWRRTGKSKTSVRCQERFMQAGYDSLLHDKARPSRIRPLQPRDHISAAQAYAAITETYKST